MVYKHFNMRVLRQSERKYFSPPGIDAQVSILAGKGEEHGSFEKHTFATVKLAPGKKLDQHFHKEREESYLIISGSGKAVVNGQTVALNPGDMLTVSPGEVHQFIAGDVQPLEYIVVTAPAWVLEDVHR